MKKNNNIILIYRKDGISRIKLNKPNSYNALSSKMIQSLIDALKKLNNDKKTKVIKT